MSQPDRGAGLELTKGDLDRMANPCPAWQDGQHLYTFQATGNPLRDAKRCACGATVLATNPQPPEMPPR